MSNNLIIKNTARGLNSNKILYLVSALLFGFLCIYFFKNSEILVETADAAAVTVPTVTDFWFYIFHGIVSNNSIDMYKIPIVWLFICVFVLIAVLNYPTKDLYSSGFKRLFAVINARCGGFKVHLEYCRRDFVVCGGGCWRLYCGAVFRRIFV